MNHRKLESTGNLYCLTLGFFVSKRLQIRLSSNAQYLSVVADILTSSHQVEIRLYILQA